MPDSDSVVGSAFRLNCGLVRDRGTVRTSTTSSICTSCNRSTNSRIERVECPMVKNGYMRSVQLTARDLRFSPNEVPHLGFRPGCQAEESLPCHVQPLGLALLYKCPHRP